MAGLAMAVAVSATSAAAQRIEATVSVDPSKPGPVIEPAVYGQFAEHLAAIGVAVRIPAG